MYLGRERLPSADSLQKMAREYSTSLQHFVGQRPFLQKFLGFGVDHLGLIAGDVDDYLNTEAVLSDFTFMVWREWKGIRRVATAELLCDISVNPFGFTNILVVEEPSMGKGRPCYEGLGYATFYQPNLAALKRSIRMSKRILYELLRDGAVAIPINEGQEVRFTCVRQNFLLARSIQSGRAKLVGGYPHTQQLEAIE